MKTFDVSKMPVMQSNCETCPFRPEGNPRLRASIEERVMTLASQTCHHTGSVHGKPDTHLCRGARDFQLKIFYRMGILDAPTDEAWAKAARKL